MKRSLLDQLVGVKPPFSMAALVEEVAGLIFLATLVWPHMSIAHMVKGFLIGAQDLIRARHQAMQDGLTLWTQRVKKTRERLTALRASAHPNARRIAGQERKLMRT